MAMTAEQLFQRLSRKQMGEVIICEQPHTVWAAEIASRLEDELPYDALENMLVAQSMERFLTENPDEVHKFIGTGIIEVDYFEEID